MKKNKKYLIKITYIKKTQCQISETSANKAILKAKKVFDNYPLKLEDKVFDKKEKTYKAIKLD